MAISHDNNYNKISTKSAYKCHLISKFNNLKTGNLATTIPRSGSTINSLNTSEIQNTEGLLVLYTDIDTNLNKREEFQTQTANMKPDIICLVEILPKTPLVLLFTNVNI